MDFDVIIIGAGPSGLTAGIYAVRSGLNVAVIEKQFAGGQIANTESVDNYPALLNISGFDLSVKMLEHAEKLGVKMIYDNVVETDFTGDIKKVITESKNELTAKAIILCAGATPRKLGLIKEDKFIGRGVSYCAVCDGAFYKNKNVVVVGGGNTAVSDCMYLSKFATAVHLVHRRDKLRASKVEINKLVNSGVVIHYNSVVTDIIGEDKVTAVKLQNVIDKSESNIEIDGIFVAIG